MISKTYSVFCDFCAQWTAQEGSIARARKAAKENGWSCTRDGGDACPQCRRDKACVK